MDNLKVYNKLADAVIEYVAGRLYRVFDVSIARLAILRTVLKLDDKNIYGIFVTDRGERVINLVEVKIMECDYSHYNKDEISDILHGYIHYDSDEMYMFMINFLEEYAENFGDY